MTPTFEEFKENIKQRAELLRRHKMLPEKPFTHWVGGARRRPQDYERALKREQMVPIEKLFGEE